LREEVLDRVVALAVEDLGAVVIECTDLVPFASAIQERLGVPVFDIVTLTEMIRAVSAREPYRVPPAALVTPPVSTGSGHVREAGPVGEDHRLDAVAQVEFGQDA
jgi:hypothetical protein